MTSIAEVAVMFMIESEAESVRRILENVWGDEQRPILIHDALIL